jgi:nucleolar protein 56
MRAYIAANFMGVFAFDNDRKLLGHRLFPKNVELIAERLEKVNKGEVIPEEKDLIRDLVRLGYKEFVWDKKVQEKGSTFVYNPDHLGKKTLTEEFRRLALELHWVTSQAELNELLSKTSISLTREKLRETKKDRILMQGVGVLDELDRVINVFSERLKEWYGLYFPEAPGVVQDNEKFAQAVSQFSSKEEITGHQLARYVKTSAGMAFSEDDIRNTRLFAETILRLFETKRTLTSYLEKSSAEALPNMFAVAGPLLCLRLISLAGGLDKAARMPTSTIQLLGAEKALFRHLRGEGKAPKYGILFSHPFVQQAPKELKGKVARLVAAKISLASRMDFFSGENRGEQLKKSLEEDVRKTLPAQK